jgi:hypothetical protein
MGILLLYCCVTIQYTVSSIATGLSSTAWDSLSEIVTLALASRTPAQVHNASAGIQSTSIFQHKIRIAATSERDYPGKFSAQDDFEPLGRQPELVFPSREYAAVSKVKINQEYGGI